MEWISLKDDIASWTGLERDALHVYAGLPGAIAAAIILQRSLASLLPWLVILLCDIGNEARDMLADGLVEQWELDGARHDLWNRMLAPTLLLLLARFSPDVSTGRPASAVHAAEETPDAPAEPDAIPGGTGDRDATDHA